MENVLVWADRVLLPIINADRQVPSRHMYIYGHFGAFPFLVLKINTFLDNHCYMFVHDVFHNKQIPAYSVVQYLRNRKHVPCFFRVIQTRVEVWENEIAVGTRAVGECFHSFFEFFQTFTSVCITRQKHGTCFLFLLKNNATRKRKTTC